MDTERGLVVDQIEESKDMDLPEDANGDLKVKQPTGVQESPIGTNIDTDMEISNRSDS